MKPAFVIVTSNTEGESKFFARDSASGGYAYWSPFLQHAEVFPRYDDAAAVLRSGDFTTPSVSSSMGGKTVRPPRMIDMAIGLGNEKKRGIVTLQICEITMSLHYQKVVEGVITEVSADTERISGYSTKG